MEMHCTLLKAPFINSYLFAVNMLRILVLLVPLFKYTVLKTAVKTENVGNCFFYSSRACLLTWSLTMLVLWCLVTTS